MFRAVARTATVLLIAGTVAGGTYLLVGPAGPSMPDPQARFRAGSVDGRVGHGRDGRREGRPSDQRERRGREEASLGHGIGGMLVTAVQIGAVAAVVAGIQTRSRRRRHRPAATARTMAGHAD